MKTDKDDPRYNDDVSTSSDSSPYAIFKKETAKDKIDNPEEVEEEIIPPLGSSLLLCGKSGSGKSTLLASLINDDDARFYTGCFDKMFLFSPTAEGDDIQKQYGIPSDYVFTNLEEAPDLITLIHDAQRDKVKEMGADNAPQYAIIFDDVIGDMRFMNSKSFTQCFYQTRHVNCTTFICTQHFKRVPRVCRMQANFICFFRGSQTEVELIAEEFAPPRVHKKDFMSMVDEATREPFAFFTINMKVPWESRFRQNLHPVLPIHVDKNFSTDKEKDDGFGATLGEQETPGSEQSEISAATRRTTRRSFTQERRARQGTTTRPGSRKWKRPKTKETAHGWK